VSVHHGFGSSLPNADGRTHTARDTRQIRISQVPVRSFAVMGLNRGRASALARVAHVASSEIKTLGPAMSDLSSQFHTHAIAVYASRHCRQWPRNTATKRTLLLTWAGLHRLIAQLCWRTHSITSSARASSVEQVMNSRRFHSITSFGAREEGRRHFEPSAWAVFEVDEQVEFGGICTGSSAGFAPLRMPVTY